MCRGALQVNANTLSAFLESPQATDLQTAERSYLQHLLARARATVGASSSEEWVDPFTWEHAAYFGAHGLAATAGFAAGLSEGCMDDFMVVMAGDMAPPSAQVIGGVGYVAGIATRVVQMAVDGL